MRDQFPFAVARVTRRWRKLLDERLKDLGVTQARWTTMVYLQQGGEGLTQRELARLMAIENPTLVRLLDSLEQQGLIERRPCPNDRRARRLHLTKDGTEFMNVLTERAARLREEMLEGISDRDIEGAVKVFHRILENAERQR
ncbi:MULTISPECIES: MarR family transcriptional regulator [Marinobacter]|jgi:MarR family transcriptional regulator for hemolysin|uniref:Transcriptional regulator n=1 Tax=Marinobacter salarius TaxID=1420917 RepID=W5YP94_9GAMM|nr:MULTISPECIES: MarR family transcriptional regulator [Marinobacter]AHI30911.1 transcriptional regulator [Marinobacter salarius]ARM82209.1 transcriptional regulator SlyA [Marinobacter salarius]AZR41059.1 transcriptional regulator SlyA [Marinobacter salarius]KXJ45771.1 MAG: MarR family transcriptional regulator [Marinobacter sp. Hex_13]MAB53245.1 MarR family transcriptional regulator [Marinobacter sp.]|tara:strand:+ start:232 stop:657 length:426 start_codon:yes stop_codon:yes gene_type:complete